MILTYKYRIKDRLGRRILNQHAIACNQVWNYCVAFQRDLKSRYLAGAPKRNWPSNFDLQKLTKGTSKEFGIHAQSIGGICKQFAQSRDKIKRTPDFRTSFGPKRALGWIPFEKQSRQTEGNAITYLGHRFRFFGGNRELPESAKGGTFVEDARGRWWVCFHVECDPRPTGDGIVGIDLGLKSLATLSTGESIPAPQFYRKYQGELARAQRAGNKKRVRAIHTKIANCRRDHLHKLTTRIARENQTIIIGNVSPKPLVKTRLAKSILDAAWTGLRSMLCYKASRHGAYFQVVDEKWTSQTCSNCGEIPQSSPKGMSMLGIREWVCSGCTVTHDRDHNAAKNILKLGLSAQPHADESRLITLCGWGPDRHGSDVRYRE